MPVETLFWNPFYPVSVSFLICCILLHQSLLQDLCILLWNTNMVVSSIHSMVGVVYASFVTQWYANLSNSHQLVPLLSQAVFSAFPCMHWFSFEFLWVDPWYSFFPLSLKASLSWTLMTVLHWVMAYYHYTQAIYFSIIPLYQSQASKTAPLWCPSHRKSINGSGNNVFVLSNLSFGLFLL